MLICPIVQLISLIYYDAVIYFIGFIISMIVLAAACLAFAPVYGLFSILGSIIFFLGLYSAFMCMDKHGPLGLFFIGAILGNPIGICSLIASVSLAIEESSVLGMIISIGTAVPSFIGAIILIVLVLRNRRL
jgi:hypothetical protein